MSSARFVLAVLVAVLATRSAWAACDAGGIDAAQVTAAREAIDGGCPCAVALTRSTYRRCATDVVRGLVLGAELETRCRREALKHAKLSTCGRPGAAVCCRVRPDGRPRHRVVRDATKCVSTPTVAACVSDWPSVPTGCDADGCVPLPVCGDGVVQGGEECDPPELLVCSATCELLECATPPSACGNGTVDPGESCEPPGVAGCFRDCQPAPCAAAGPGEIDVACVSGPAAVGAAATATTYLVGWDGPQRRAVDDVLVRRFDANGQPLDDTVTVPSEDACFASHSGPALASDGLGFYAVWSAFGGDPEIQVPFEAMYGRRLGGAAGAEALDELAFLVPFGQCRTDIFGPTMAAGVSPARFAVGWNTGGSCFPGGLLFQNPIGRILDFDPSPNPQGAGLGYPFGPPPGIYSSSAARVATLGPDTLWAWHALTALSSSGPFTYFVAAVWTDPGGSTPRFELTSRSAFVLGRPALAAGAGSLLVAWAQGATPSGTAGPATEIRAVRVTRAAGALDPAPGLLLATVPTQVTGAPAIAFDGARWLVVWAEAAGAGSELRAVAVESDGTVVDPTARLVAGDVRPQEPAAASTGDGRVLVLYARPDGPNSGVRATLVMP